ncbi:hypothetical protein K431DRAFT_293348 [Polychaeton citri CBS 116435]|uniref:Uncharacterized protein n=1 Tax=Polychaeton citri CBS 116435 TaxID=1314669 RepID=A0A9P4QD19_9PEZI|nr:hypothetical protein K431DRAFT_293348 [Polychaeton citri CBS 116435]
MATHTQVYQLVSAFNRVERAASDVCTIEPESPHILLLYECSKGTPLEQLRVHRKTRPQAPISSADSSEVVQTNSCSLLRGLHFPDLQPLDQALFLIGRCHTIGRMHAFERGMTELHYQGRFRYADDLAALPKIVGSPGFGGAWLDPPLAATFYFSDVSMLSAAAHATGRVDMITPTSCNGKHTLVADNITSKAIQSALTKNHRANVFQHRPALVFVTAEASVVDVVFALIELKCNPIYTIGIEFSKALATRVHRINSLDGLRNIANPCIMVSDISSRQSKVVESFRRQLRLSKCELDIGMAPIYIDLSGRSSLRTPSSDDPVDNWTMYNQSDIRLWTMAEITRSLTGQDAHIDPAKRFADII